MGRLVDLIDRCWRHIPRDSRLARILEPLASMFIVFRVQRGSTRSILRFVRRHGVKVGAGPFAGLKYPRSAVLQVLYLVSRLAGTFELELHGVVETLIRSRPSLLINIGAADGYYAVGMALRCPDADVIAYEANPLRSRVCSRVARLNGVENRLDLRGVCTADALARLDPSPGAVVICDVDGAEAELIDPARVGWLRGAMLLVEVHESLAPGVTSKLRERLQETHSVEWIEPRRRYLADPEHRMFWSTGLSPVQQQMLMSEVRPVRTPWLWATPAIG
jgi:hypothetical protein